MAHYPIDGEKRYEKTARAALPLLVRQAEAGEPIYYSDLAGELGYPNPRNLNYPLGAIGETLHLLSIEWGENVPQIQALVVAKGSGVPGLGISGFLEGDFRRLSEVQKKEFIKGELQKIILYPYWDEVLEALCLEPAHLELRTLNQALDNPPRGESEAHKRLKQFVAENPSTVGLKPLDTVGELEVPLPSGDTLDVSFDNKGQWVAVEVKTAKSPEHDILRGIYQCVKYSAVMQAIQVSENLRRNVRVVLLLEGVLPTRLLGLKNALGIEVIDNVVIPNA